MASKFKESAKGDLSGGFSTLNCDPDMDIVISGISGSFPESNDVYELRENLFNKKDMITSGDRRCNPGKICSTFVNLMISILTHFKIIFSKIGLKITFSLIADYRFILIW